MTTTADQPPTRPYGGVSAPARVAARRRRFVDAGREAFGSDGFAAVRVKDVCHRAGLSTRYFYESFQNLGDLFRAVHEDVIDTLYQSVTDAIRAVGNEAGTALRVAIRAFVDTLAAEPARWRIVFTEPAAVDDAARQASRVALRRFRELVASVARANLPAHVPERDVQLLALSVVGTLDHVIAEWLDGELALTSEELVDACAARFEALFLDLRTTATS